jgi:hypothetical protein
MLCGVLWCSVVFCGVLWCSVVFCGVLWCCVLLLEGKRVTRRSMTCIHTLSTTITTHPTPHAVQSYRATSYFLEPLDAPRAALPSPFPNSGGDCDSAGDSFIPQSQSPATAPQTPSNAKRGQFSLDGERLEYGGISVAVMPAAASVLSL